MDALDQDIPVSPKAGATAESIRLVLRDQRTAIGNLAGVGSGKTVNGLVNDYLRSANNAALALAAVVSRSDVERLILTPRYWALCGADASAKANMSLISLEIHERTRAFSEIEDSLQRFTARWNREQCGHLIVADTCIYLHCGQPFEELPWRNYPESEVQVATLVVPLVVVDELDKAKLGNQSAAARATIRTMESRFSGSALLATLSDPGTSARLLLEPPAHVRTANADAEIVRRAADLAALSGLALTVVTYDYGMALRANAAGLHARWLEQPDRKARTPTSNQEGNSANIRE